MVKSELAMKWQNRIAPGPDDIGQKQKFGYKFIFVSFVSLADVACRIR